MDKARQAVVEKIMETKYNEVEVEIAASYDSEKS